jgi:hypothetical protein
MGVTNGSPHVPYFGPANRPDYDQNSWAMVPVAGMAESNADCEPLPSMRKRVEGAPAFLIQPTDNSSPIHRLGAILTILHEIPMARNILLQGGTPAASYGHNSEWWKGQPILPPHVLAALDRGELHWKGDTKPDYTEELHRLVAFLDSTERSYGSTAVIADTLALSQYGKERQFYDTLIDEYGQDAIKPMLHTAVVEYMDQEETVGEPNAFSYLELDIPRANYDQMKTFYEVLDHTFWFANLSEEPDREIAVLQDTGEVISVMLGSDGPRDSVEIPEVWYPERYLQTRKEEARMIQKDMSRMKQRLSSLRQWEFRHTKVVDPQTNRVHDRRELINWLIKTKQSDLDYYEGLSQWKSEVKELFDDPKYPAWQSLYKWLEQHDDTLRSMPDRCTDSIKYYEANLHVVERHEQGRFLLRADYTNLQPRLTFLALDADRIRDQIEARLRWLGKLLTDPNKERPRPMTCKKYLLRGVASAPNIVYVCKRQQPGLIDLEDTPAPIDQWWRLAYMKGDADPVKVEVCPRPQSYQHGGIALEYALFPLSSYYLLCELIFRYAENNIRPNAKANVGRGKESDHILRN